MPNKEKHQNSNPRSNLIQSLTSRYSLFLLAGITIASLLMYWVLNRPVSRINQNDIAERLANSAGKPINFVNATVLADQFRDCLAVNTPKGGGLEELLPAGEYYSFLEKFDLSIRTATALSDRPDQRIGSCTGIDRLYELKPLIEMRCNCKIDIKCAC